MGRVHGLRQRVRSTRQQVLQACWPEERMVPREQSHRVQGGVDAVHEWARRQNVSLHDDLSSDSCCGGACVSRGDACRQNVLGNHFPCQVNKWGEGGCCGNACYAPGSKCCWSPWVAKARWYPVTKATKCAF